MSSNVKSEWLPEHQEAFNNMKKKFEERPILVTPDPNKPFEIETDASLYTSGAVLYQKDDAGIKRPIAFHSQAFSPTEQNYHCSEQEWLAIIHALKTWRHHLEGAKHKFIVWGDHENLSRFKEPMSLNRQQAHWTAYMQRFKPMLKIKHIPGKRNGPADTLSQQPNYAPDQKDNQEITVFNDSLIAIIMEDDKKIIRQFCDMIDPDDDDTPNNDVLTHQGKILIPNDQDLQRSLIKRIHNHVTAGHPGVAETLRKLQEHVYWPAMRDYSVVQKYRTIT
ncbi:hypothetical protein NP233_g307 [Leucocoprinus birnbaumii]|uniref:Uncharacterized protein n=1 Tax=Leucocoprinus birnbaumii TaxID=56174 RepID=A0AAD5W214_9AGAR|nr:hypothetical protein NP233_g307 [Leucocoprinus birnbaumii]